MKNYNYSCEIEGEIIKIQKGLKPSFIKSGNRKFKFNMLTNVSGCMFKHLDLGDKVLIKKVRTKGNFCLHIQLLDVENKWNNILKSDDKYSIIHNLEYGPNGIRPEIITPTKVSYVTEKLNGVMEQIKEDNKSTSKLELKVLNLYLEGKTVRGISEIVKVSHMTCSRIIKKYIEG